MQQDLASAIDQLNSSYEQLSKKIMDSLSPEQREAYKKEISSIDNAVRNFKDIDPNKLFQKISQDIAKKS